MPKNDSEKYIKSVAAFNSGVRNVSNSPNEYSGRGKRYMANRKSLFNANRAYLSSDYVEAEVQGLSENFYEWVRTFIRLADISEGTASSNKKTDDYKQVLIPDMAVDYFPIGAMIKSMGSTWISINPANISKPSTTSIVARCNTSYNSYDYYGNVITEPIIVEKYSMLGNDNEKKSNLVLMDGYFNVTCQLNGNTEQLKENSRIILGKKAYHITGMTDFIQEFTGNRDSCHLLNFTIRVEEPTESDDITENFIAGGNEQDFYCVMQAVEDMAVGDEIPFLAHFLKNGEFVTSTEEHPVTWIWESDNTEVAEVDQNGLVRAKSSGNAVITAKLAENNDITAVAELVVKQPQIGENSVVFTSIIPESISQYESVIISAVYKKDGKPTKEPIEWNFDGTDGKDDYTAVILGDGKSVEITCNSPSEGDLRITASCKGFSATATIELLGY